MLIVECNRCIQMGLRQLTRETKKLNVLPGDIINFSFYGFVPN
jgi:hypothetical protein